MVVLVVEIKDFTLFSVDTKSDPPIPGDADAPNPLTATLELVHSPGLDRMEFLRVSHVLKKGEDLTQLVNRGRRQPS